MSRCTEGSRFAARRAGDPVGPSRAPARDGSACGRYTWQLIGARRSPVSTRRPGCRSPLPGGRSWLGTGCAQHGQRGEPCGHQLQWPLNDITEAAINPFYGAGVGMLHIKAQTGRRTDTFNFFVVHVTDQVAINRRPEAELLVGLINGLKPKIGR